MSFPEPPHLRRRRQRNPNTIKPKDLAMKAPILRLAKGDSRGDIDIGNETINYLAKPTVVQSLKGQGGADLDSLAGLSIPVKITGTFSAPKFGMDFAAIGAAAAKSQLLDKVGFK